MKLIFAGTPEFAQIALARLHAAGHEIALVMTQPDRPAGRGMKLQASAVKQFALAHGLPVIQPRSLRLDGKYPDDAAAARNAIADTAAAVMVVAAYGLILPQWVLDAMQGTAQFGCINIHGSLLPRWRGAAPIHRAIEAGDSQTGITIMQMDAGLDTGAILLAHSVPIGDLDTTATLHNRLADLGAEMALKALAQAEAHQLQACPQPELGASYAPKIEKHEAAIDWRAPALSIARRVRAFDPFPGASTSLQGHAIKVWAAEAVSGPALLVQGIQEAQEPGVILSVSRAGIAVAAMNSIVVLTELQRPGGKRLAVADFLRGFDVHAGMRFDAAPS